MKLDPEAAAVISRILDSGIPPWHSMPAPIGRDVYRQRALLIDGPRTPTEGEWDTMVKSKGGEVGVRIYPLDGNRSRPIFIYLHGGGWTFGDLDLRDDTCRRISRAADCVVVSVAYRLAPEHPYPAPLDDVTAVIRWVAGHGDAIGGDASLLALGGDSAGGNLAAGACLRLREERGPRVALQVLINPALRASFDTRSYHENADGYLLTRADMIWMWQNYLGPTGDVDDPYACPGAATDLRNLPPALIVAAGFDPLRDEAEVYGHQLRAAGVPVEVRRFPGMIHNFIGLRIESAASRAIDMIAAATGRAWAPGGWT